MRSVRNTIAFLAATLALGAALPVAAQYDGYGYSFGYSGANFAEQLRHERERAEWRAVVALLADFRTAYRRPAIDTHASGPTSWRAQNENPWANAYGTPSSSGYSASTRALSGSTVKMCTCYLPSDARSWDGGPLSPADIARRCQAQCF
jgi:hypothetical protein